MRSSFYSWCSWTKWVPWRNLRFSFFVSNANQVEWGRKMSPRFPFVTPRVWELSLRPTASERWHNLVCMECLQMIKPMVVGFCSIGDWWWVWQWVRGGGVRQNRKSYSGPAEIASFFRRSHRRCCIKKLFLKFLQYAQENTYVRILERDSNTGIFLWILRKF